MKKILLLTIFTLCLVKLESAPTVLSNDQLQILDLVSANTDQIEINALNIGTHSLLITSNTDSIDSSESDIAGLATDVLDLQNEKFDKVGGTINGDVVIASDNLTLGDGTSANGNAILNFKSFFGTTKTAQLVMRDSDGKLGVIQDGGAFLELGQTGVPTYQEIYNNDTAGTTKLNVSGSMRITASDNSDIFVISDTGKVVTIENLTVNGTQTTLSTTNIDTDAIALTMSIFDDTAMDLRPTTDTLNWFTGKFLTCRDQLNGPVRFEVDSLGNITSSGGNFNSITIDSEIRKDILPSWKKGTLADGDVFTRVRTQRAMTVTSIDAQVMTASTAGDITYEVAYTTSLSAPSWTLLHSAGNTISATNNLGNSVTLANTNIPAGAWLRYRVITADSAGDAEDLIVNVVGTY